MSHRLLIQLARLGDLLQSLPAITSLQAQSPKDQLDLLCAAPLVALGSFFPDIGKVFPWNGDRWAHIAQNWSQTEGNALSHAAEYLNQFQLGEYSLAYNLNNHSRAIIAAHLLAKDVRGSGCQGPLSSYVPKWVSYLNLVGAYRGRNRVHLADAFCGICGVRPPLTVPTLDLLQIDWPNGLGEFGDGGSLRVALVIGSGDPDRRIPLGAWEQWICSFLSDSSGGRVVLIGGPGERELTYTLLDRIPPMYHSRIWDACGRTTLPELASLLSHCHWVIGSDTGPLHLGVACGAKAQGIYFSRARVHETGPYGEGHWVWQAEREGKNDKLTVKTGEPKILSEIKEGVRPESWPVKESVELLFEETCEEIPRGWSLWKSHSDELGAYYSNYCNASISQEQRTEVWEVLQDSEEIDHHRLEDLVHVKTQEISIQGLR